MIDPKKVVDVITTTYNEAPENEQDVVEAVNELYAKGGDRIIYLTDGREVTIIGNRDADHVYITSHFELVSKD